MKPVCNSMPNTQGKYVDANIFYIKANAINNALSK